ncbi:MAG: hypothetical protein WC069_03475 [Candidatus Shapirobacteria bacterium]
MNKYNFQEKSHNMAARAIMAVSIAMAHVLPVNFSSDKQDISIYDRYTSRELYRMVLNGDLQARGACDEGNLPTKNGECQIVETTQK